MDTDKADRRIWLVKVPPRVAKRWKQACTSDAPMDLEAPDTVLGTISIKPADDNKNVLTLHLPADGPDGPATYTMVPSTQQQHCLAFSYASVDGTGRAADARVEGVVGQRFDMVPVITPQAGAGRGGGALLDDQYRSLNRRRTHDAANRGRTMQLIDDPKAGAKLSNVGPLWSKDKKRVAPGAASEVREAKRRVRLERDDLEAQLFGLFGRQPHWHFTQLQKETDQPAGWLKEVLNAVAFQNKRGPHKDLWELQKHLKVGGAGAGGDGSGEAVAGGGGVVMQG